MNFLRRSMYFTFACDRITKKVFTRQGTTRQKFNLFIYLSIYFIIFHSEHVLRCNIDTAVTGGSVQGAKGLGPQESRGCEFNECLSGNLFNCVT